MDFKEEGFGSLQNSETEVGDYVLVVVQKVAGGALCC